jgi:hypothetical protein
LPYNPLAPALVYLLMAVVFGFAFVKTFKAVRGYPNDH